jgi:hypothetical protein
VRSANVRLNPWSCSFHTASRSDKTTVTKPAWVICSMALKIAVHSDTIRLGDSGCYRSYLRLLRAIALALQLLALGRRSSSLEADSNATLEMKTCTAIFSVGEQIQPDSHLHTSPTRNSEQISRQLLVRSINHDANEILQSNADHVGSRINMVANSDGFCSSYLVGMPLHFLACKKIWKPEKYAIFEGSVTLH